MKLYISTTQHPRVIYGKKIKKRPAWLQISNRKKIKIIQLNNTLYTHRFKGYFVPNDANKEELKSFFNTIALIYNKICQQNKIFGQWLLKELSRKPKKIKILDIMAGTGLPNIVLYQAGYINQTLLDISRKMLEQAQKAMPDIITHVCSFEYVEPDKKFDVVFSALGLHYMDFSWNKFASKMQKFLNKKGLLIIIESNPVPKLKGFKIIKTTLKRWNSGTKTTNLYYYVFEKN